ncbi:MAG: T9SS type A sorting domain-containing protein, partial [Cytophagales bacterium]
EQYDKKDLYTYSDTLLVIKDTSIFKYQYLGKTKYFKFNIKSIEQEEFAFANGNLKWICDSLVEKQVFAGFLDSVKVFSIHSLIGGNFKKISHFELSKQYGLIEYPAFERILFENDTMAPITKLSKIESVNLKPFVLSDYFHLSVGDKLFYEIRKQTNSPLPFDYYEYDIDSILDSQITEDSVTYIKYSLGTKSTSVETYYKKDYELLLGGYDNDVLYAIFIPNSGFEIWSKQKNIQNGNISFGLTVHHLDYENCREYVLPDVAQYFSMNTLVGVYTKGTESSGKSTIGSIINGQKNGNTTVMPTEIESFSFSEVSIYPNPFENEIRISSTLAPFQYTITDLAGGKVAMGMTTNNNTINLSHLPLGTYVLNFKINENTITKKITKI